MVRPGYRILHESNKLTCKNFRQETGILATHYYDCFFLFDSNRYNRDPGGVAASVQDTVTKFGGEILASRLWDERRLAFLVNGQSKGTYWITYFKMDPLQLKEFTHECKLNENIMRMLVTRVDARLIDTLVAHALGKASHVGVREVDRAVVPAGVLEEELEEFDVEEEV